MCWLLCDYSRSTGRVPSSAMFRCTDESIGYARAGVAKLNDVMGWSCDFYERDLESVRLAPTGRDAVMLFECFDEGVCVTHPTTGEPVLPPVSFSAICKAAYEGDVMRAFSNLFKSRGWVGEMEAKRVYR